MFSLKSVYDAHLVRGGERVAKLLENEQQHWRSNGAGRFDVRRKIGTREQFHGHPWSPCRCIDARAHDVNDVVAFDARTDARLLLEPPSQRLIGDHLWMHQLEGAARTRADLIDDINRSHAARAEGSDNAKIIREDGAWFE
jgi:hypothetical protein